MDGGSRIPAPEEINWVRSKIHHCTSLSMDKNQTVDFLDSQLKIPRIWTRTVWKIVEEEKIERLNRLRQNGHQHQQPQNGHRPNGGHQPPNGHLPNGQPQNGHQQRGIMHLPNGQYGRFTVS